MLWDYFSLIFKDLKGRKFSSFLTFFAISLGILTIFVIILISQGFQQSIQTQFEQIGSNRLIITASGGNVYTGSSQKGLTDSEVKLLENKPYISDASAFSIKTTSVKFSSESIQTMVYGIPFKEDIFEDYNLEIDKGRYPKEDRYGIVIGPEVAENGYGKEIQVGSNLYINNTKFKVIGILKSVGTPQDDSMMYVNIDTLRNVFDLGDNVDMIYATVEEGYDVNLAANNTKIVLENKLGDDTVNVQTFEQMIEQVNNILGIVQATLGGIAFVSLIVGAVGIINTMFVIITEKTKEIGIMKAIGATNGNILILYVLQAGVFGLLGAVLGLILGSFGAFGFESWASQNGYTFLKITIDPMIVGILLLFGFFIGALSGFIPAYRASKLSIVETFRK